VNDERAVDLLLSMVAIQSLSHEEAELARFLVAEMSRLGFDAAVDAAGNAVGEIGTGPRTIVLAGHMDTVPGDLPVRIEDGKLHGRGSVDAKGPLAAFVAAAARFGARGPGGMGGLRVVVAGCVQEEVPSSAGARHLAQRAAPDLLVVGEPSGWDGITLGYKGYLRARVAVRGEAKHTAHAPPTTPERGVDAWIAVRAACAEYNAGRERTFDQLMPALLEVRTESDGVHERCAFELTLRLPLDLGPEAAVAWLRERAGEGAEVEVLGALPAWAGPRTSELHRALARAILEEGGRPVYKHKTGTADLNILAPAWGVPALAYGPGDAALDHTPKEHMVLEEYLAAVRVLEGMLAACATGDGAGARRGSGSLRPQEAPEACTNPGDSGRRGVGIPSELPSVDALPPRDRSPAPRFREPK